MKSSILGAWQLLWVFLGAALFAGSSVAFAADQVATQSPTSAQQWSALLACKRINQENQRLACLDRVLAEMTEPEEDSVGVVVSPSGSNPPASNSAAPGLGGAAPGPQEPTLANSDAQRVVEETETARESSGSATVAESEELGAEDLRRPQRSKKPKSVVLTLQQVGKDGFGKYYFVFDNGQRWQQIRSETRKLRLPRSPQGKQVTIKRGAFGSHILSLEGDRRSIKVERTK